MVLMNVYGIRLFHVLNLSGEHEDIVFVVKSEWHTDLH